MQMVLPTLTPGATVLALRHVLNNLQSTIQARTPPDLSRALVITLGMPMNPIAPFLTPKKVRMKPPAPLSLSLLLRAIRKFPPGKLCALFRPCACD